MVVPWHNVKINELKEDNRYLKQQNDLLYNKLAKTLRFIEAYSLVGKREVPIEGIKEIISSKEMK